MAQHLYETGECLNMHDGINTFNVMKRTECGKALKAAARCRRISCPRTASSTAGTAASCATAVTVHSRSTARRCCRASGRSRATRGGR
eukprot:204569-Prymnesium_polylepis.1